MQNIDWLVEAKAYKENGEMYQSHVIFSMTDDSRNRQEIIMDVENRKFILPMGQLKSAVDFIYSSMTDEVMGSQ